MPEIVRESNDYSNSNNASVHREEIYSEFTTPNRFECLAQLDSDAISLEDVNTSPHNPNLEITPPAGQKKTPRRPHPSN